MNSYNIDTSLGDGNDDNRPQRPSGLFQEGDLLIRFHGCGTAPERDCEKEMKSKYETWLREVRRLDGKQIPGRS